MNELSVMDQPEWVLLLATMLLNMESIEAILDEAPDLWDPYKATLEKSEWSRLFCLFAFF